MHFDLSTDQQMIEEQARQFARAEIGPMAHRWESERRFAQEGLDALGELGFLGLCVTEEYDGAQADGVALVRSLAELSWADASIATIAALQNGFVASFLLALSESPLKRRLLSGLVVGEEWGAWAPPNLRMFASKTLSIQALDDHRWRLDGEVRSVALATKAPWTLLFVVDEQEQWHGFCVPKDHPGMTTQKVEGALGLRGTGTAHLRFEDVVLDDTHRLGEPREIEAAFLYASRRGRVALAAVTLGVAQRALDEAVRYAKERRQFGRPLSAFQAIQWKVADMAMQIEAARLMIDEAAWSWSQGDEPLLESQSAAAIFYVTELAGWVTQEAIQIHGGFGFTTEFPVEKLYRDAQTLQARWDGRERHIHQFASGWWQRGEG